MSNGLSWNFVVMTALVAVFGVTDSFAQFQTVSAKGSVTVDGFSCNFVEPDPGDQCHVGGSGAKINFSFQGEVIDPLTPALATSASLTAYYPDTGLRVRLMSGEGFIFRNAHAVIFSGTCETARDLGGITVLGSGTCSVQAHDRTPNGAIDTVSLVVTTASGLITAGPEAASGNVNIE